MKRIKAWWQKRKEYKLVLAAQHEKFIHRAEAILAVDSLIEQAIKDGDLEKTKSLYARRNSLPCPMCGRTS